MQNQSQNQAEPKESPWTILKLLSWTTSYFKTHDIDYPRAAAEILLAHTLEVERIDLYLRYDQPLSPPELASFKTVIKRRVSREPVAYIVGEKEFWSMPLAVTRDVLIPRPETECLVEAALAVLPKGRGACPQRVLELGTGSGAIVIALASERPSHVFWASDISLQAIAMARRNAVRHDLDARIRFLVGDWFSALPADEPPFDVILSNPPYIASAEITKLQPEIQKFEPRLALDGSENGLRSLVHIIQAAPRFLKPGGYLLLEFGADQRRDLQRVIEASGHYEAFDFTRDYSGLDRVVRLRAKSADRRPAD